MPDASIPDTDAHNEQTFRWTQLPRELQRHVIEQALLPGSNVSIISLLSSCRTIRSLAQRLIYEHIQLTSIRQTLLFVEGRQRRAKRRVAITLNDEADAIADAIASIDLSSRFDDDAGLVHDARSFALTIPGVPGGSTRGGRASALSSPERRSRDQQQQQQQDANKLLEPSLSSRRLLLASQAMSLCPNVEHCDISMFGVRHSSMLTSADYLAEESSTFRNALAQMRHLRSFSWRTPRENDNFVGFSVAVVDIAIAPLIEGLQTAAINLLPDGRRRQHVQGSLDRFVHPLEQIELHHCILPISSDPRNSILCLFAQVHPDDKDWALFPQMQSIYIRTAINVAPVDLAYLALFWQLRLDEAVQSDLSSVEKFQLSLCRKQDPVIELSYVFVHSIWGPRVTMEAVRLEMDTFVRQSEPASEDVDTRDVGISEPSEAASSSNPYIRALDESTDTKLKLSDGAKKRLRKLSSVQRARLIDAAMARVRIRAVEGAIAGV